VSKHLVTLIYGKVVGKATGDLSATAAYRKAVLVALADRANDDGSGVYVSKTRVAAELECDRSTVSRVCQTLEDDGFLHVVGKKTGNHGYTDIYQISVSKILDLPDAWAKCGNRNTLDESLGEDADVSPSATHAQVQVLQKAGSSVASRDKNRPYRTIENNLSDSKKSASRAERQQSPDQEAALLRWEAVRLRASDPERAREMEQRADDLTFAEIQKSKKKVEH
jgi:hypothetical protein